MKEEEEKEKEGEGEEEENEKEVKRRREVWQKLTYLSFCPEATINAFLHPTNQNVL